MRRRARLAVTAVLMLVMGLGSSASVPPANGFVGLYRWQMDHPRFGGFSGLEVSEDGMSFLTISDRATWVRGTFTRDASGAITGVTATSPELLKGAGNAPLAEGRNDSEGLRIAPDGSVYISFEEVARVLHYPAIEGPAENLPTPREFRRFGKNKALETLAIDRDGTLYTIPERPVPASAPYPVWRYKGGTWDIAFTLPPDGSFLPVDADFGPDGRLYVLERQFRGIFGFTTHVRALTLANDRIVKDRLVLETTVGTYDNLEGLSVWRDAGGDLRLTMISDDNFYSFQQTQFVEYRIPG